MLQLNKFAIQTMFNCYKSLLLLLLLGISINVLEAYMTPGWVEPDRVTLPIGSDLNITCTINEGIFQDIHNTSKPANYCNVTDMYFKVKIDNGPTKIYNKSPEIEPINKTTIRFNAQNLSEQEGNYLCMCGTNGIFTSYVYVGTKPKPIEDFSCTSYEWEYMFCNFTMPKNKIITRYNISFETQRNSSYYYFVDCNYDSSPLVKCNITQETYKKFPENYYFRLEMDNPLGYLSQSIEVNNYERMILARPGQNLVVINKTQDSICLAWEMPRRSNFIGGVLWQVHVTPLDFGTMVRPMWRNNSSALRDVLCLTELEYAGYNYTLELRVRNNKTKSRWSPALYYDFRTAPARPHRPPRVTNGSFYVYSSESMLTVYWEQLEKHELNGNHFGYVVSEYRVNNTPTDSSKITVDINSATFENWTQTATHEIYIRSSNEVNTSVESSLLVIPPINSEDMRLRVPKKIRSVYHANNSSYTLSWMAPENSTDLINYTVFWCNSKPALQSKCDGSIHFEHVSKDRLQYTTKSSQSTSLNMAVSANFVNRNTGMHWVICTQDGTNDLAKMEPVIEGVSNFTLSVKWSTERVCPSILKGYNLTYCQRSDGKPDNCTTKKLDPNAVDYTIHNLEPFTFYNIKMLMFSDLTASKYSDDLINRTGEASPTQPRELKYSQVTSSSVLLSWKPPLKANGVVRDYKIKYVHDNRTDYYKLPALTGELVDNEKPVTFELINLTAYTEYEITIQACTLYDSETSNVVYFRTAVGEPSQPSLYVYNTQQSVTLEWTEPQRPFGRLDYYEVSLIERNSNNTFIDQYTSYIGSQQNRSCVMKILTCTPLHRFFYQVRAVNVELLQSESLPTTWMMDADETPGQWECESQPALSVTERGILQSYRNKTLYRVFKSKWATHEVSCSPDRSNAKWLLNSFEVLIAMIVVGAALQTGYKKYLKMSDIDLEFPKGMIDSMKNPIEMSTGMGMGPDGPSGGIICTRIDTSPQYLPQYSPQDMPHDFSSGNESSKLLLVSNSSNSGGGTERDTYEDPQPATAISPDNYMSMAQVLLLDDENNAGAPELRTSANGNNSNTDANGYIKPTQMKNWSNPLTNNANTLPPSSNMPMLTTTSTPFTYPMPMDLGMPLSGYVPVQVLQTARNMPTSLPQNAAAAPINSPPLNLLNTGNYVQASDLHKLKPMAPITTGIPATPTATTVASAATPTAATATNLPPATNIFGYTSMEQLMKMPPANNAQQTGGQMQQQHRLQPNIGGYVTPQELNAIAHNRHML